MSRPELTKGDLVWANEWLDAWEAVISGLAHDEFSIGQLHTLLMVEVYYRSPRAYVIKKLFTRYWKMRGKAYLALLRKDAGI